MDSVEGLGRVLDNLDGQERSATASPKLVLTRHFFVETYWVTQTKTDFQSICCKPTTSHGASRPFVCLEPKIHKNCRRELN